MCRCHVGVEHNMCLTHGHALSEKYPYFIHTIEPDKLNKHFLASFMITQKMTYRMIGFEAIHLYMNI